MLWDMIWGRKNSAPLHKNARAAKCKLLCEMSLDIILINITECYA